MDRQKVYDIVKAHLLEQNGRSSDDDKCLYRGEDGMQCAVGCLIPDDLYDEDMEGKSAAQLFLLNPDLAKLWDYDIAKDARFVDDLQDVHDHEDVDFWESRLGTVADEWELKG